MADGAGKRSVTPSIASMNKRGSQKRDANRDNIAFAIKRAKAAKAADPLGDFDEVCAALQENASNAGSTKGRPRQLQKAKR